MALSSQQMDQLPTTIVLDRNGAEIKRFQGFTPEAELENAVKALL